MNLNGFDNYDVHSLIQKNNESGEPEIKKIGEKLLDKNNYIICNSIRNERCNQINYRIQEFDPHILGKLENGTFINCKPLPLLEERISPHLFKKVAYYMGCSPLRK